MALNKDPDEVLDYRIDWTDRLDSDTISSSTWVVPAGITQDSVSNTTTGATIWLSGGTSGERYRLVNRVETAGGRTLEEAITILVVASIDSIVPLDDVKVRLRIDTDDDDSALEGYIAAATQAICVGYLKDETLLDTGSSPQVEIDARVTTAIIMLVGYWYRNPDSDPDKDFEQGYLPKPITAMLYPMRDPTLA